MSAPVLSERPLPCAVCRAIVSVASVTTPHPESPEMVRVPPGAWMGFVQGDHAPEMVTVCSTECLDRLFEEPS